MNLFNILWVAFWILFTPAFCAFWWTIFKYDPYLGWASREG